MNLLQNRRSGDRKWTSFLPGAPRLRGGGQVASVKTLILHSSGSDEVPEQNSRWSLLCHANRQRGSKLGSEPWIHVGPGHNTPPPPRTSNCPFPCLTCGWRLHRRTTGRRRFWSRTRTLGPACRLADTEPGTCPRPGRRRGSHSPPAAALISNQYQDQQLMDQNILWIV